MPSDQQSALQIWGGIECTVNRVQEEFFDQIEASGHCHRLTDLEAFAALSLKALRYPLLWERLQPTVGQAIDWSWSDQRLEFLRSRNIQPIVGLVHHGSGPRSTNLLAADFPIALADYASLIAERYPWLNAYTPVNEPLTTARFSALYGHWYPHHRDPRSFCEALLTQCRAVVLAMHAIRQINPSAQLIQTEDLGRIYSTPDLAYQAEFENNRRWITWDLLCGTVDSKHPLWSYFLACGVSTDRLDWFLQNPCPPDVLGINYYVTSERFLDSRLDRYPLATHGGNHITRYADVEAVRVLAEGIGGVKGVLREAWNRYRRPIAITEAHLGCTREEQMRWLWEVWQAAQQARQRGVDVRAVTAWSLLGAYDWDSLLTRRRGCYESGVFDLRGAVLRPTALAGLIRALACRQKVRHPILKSPGWWRRPTRLLYPPVTLLHPRPRRPQQRRSIGFCNAKSRPILIAGGYGHLAQAFGRICEARGLEHRILTRQQMDIANLQQVGAAIQTYRPWAIVNAAGYADVDAAETDPERCYRENELGPSVLASACAEHRIRMITYSSDLVFDGEARRPYLEDDTPAPLNVYGRNKLAAEQNVLTICPQALVVRTGSFYGPWDHVNFVSSVVAAALDDRAFPVSSDTIVSPTYVPDLVHSSLDLLIDGEHGIWHLSNAQAVSWADFGRHALRAMGIASDCLQVCESHELALPARRPRYSVLSSQRSEPLLPDLEHSLYRYAREYLPARQVLAK